jgi:hypothetical protein
LPINLIEKGITDIGNLLARKVPKSGNYNGLCALFLPFGHNALIAEKERS